MKAFLGALPFLVGFGGLLVAWANVRWPLRRLPHRIREWQQIAEALPKGSHHRDELDALIHAGIDRLVYKERVRQGIDRPVPSRAQRKFSRLRTGSLVVLMLAMVLQVAGLVNAAMRSGHQSKIWAINRGDVPWLAAAYVLTAVGLLLAWATVRARRRQVAEEVRRHAADIAQVRARAGLRPEDFG